MKLTNAKLRSLTIGKKVSDEVGLYYQPTAANRDKWSFRFAIDGKNHEMELSTYPETSLKEARLAHAEQRKVFVCGKNPLENKRMLERQRIAKETIKLSYIVDFLIKAKKPAWRNSKNESQWRSTLET